MPGRLAIDFGTSNTVVAVWDPERDEATALRLGEYAHEVGSGMKQSGSKAVPVVPSLIHYAEGNRRWLGAQVVDRGLYGSRRTFRWMKHYIARRNPRALRIGGRDVTADEAGRDFLTAVLRAAAAEVELGDEEVALAVPVEAFEHYEDWLASVAEGAGLRRFRLIDEPSAAALGYGTPLQAGDAYLIFDFGGGTLDVAIVLVESEEAVGAGKRCRVLGKAGAEVGGAMIDSWLFQEVLRQSGRQDADQDVRRASRKLLAACERAKEELSARDTVEVQVPVADTGRPLMARLSRARMEEIMDEHEAFAQIARTVRRALDSARERGYTEDQVKAVLMVGGSSAIPAVQQTVQRTFGRERVRRERPLDAVARGAAAFVAGVDFLDHIQHDYAVRSVDPTGGSYVYHRIIRQGLPYPTREPVARLTVKASHDGQARLGLAIFEMAGAGRPSTEAMELVFDSSGAARLARVTPDEDDRQQHFWVNEASPTFLAADPPARRSEARFEVEFGIDANKRLLVSARDLRTGRMVLRDHAVIRLS